MLPLLFWIVILIASLSILIKASDLFTESAEKIGVWLGFSSFVIGITIVAIGTSLPELASSLAAVLANSSEIVVGNVIGSNIANITLILGLAIIIKRKIVVTHSSLREDVLFFLVSAILLGVTIIDGKFTRLEGLCFVILLSLYLYHLRKRENIKIENNNSLSAKTILTFATSLALIYFGAKYTIEAVIHISDLTGIGKEIISASAVALGTSLPELAVSLAAARKGKMEISVGNVMGSNIFNIFGVMGFPALFSSLTIPESMINFGLPTMLMVTFLVAAMTLKREMHMLEGFLLVSIYIFFISKLYFV